MGDGTVRREETALGATILLDRPQRRNALTVPMWAELGRLAREAGGGVGLAGGVGCADGALHLRGAGGYFCAGADLDALRWGRESPEQADLFVRTVVECLLSLHLAGREVAGREVVAVVEGGAAGGGVEIMAACDRRVAIGEPSLVFPFGRHGMTLDDFTRWRLHRLVGDAEAGRLVDGHHVLSCAEAMRLGLFDERHETLEDFVAAERARLGNDGGSPRGSHLTGSSPTGSYLTGTDEAAFEEAVRRTAAPMRTAFPPHR